MGLDAYCVIGILLVAVLLFAFDVMAPEIVAVAVLIILTAAGILTPQEAFAGFSSSAVVAIGALLVIGAGLVRTGVVKWLADRLGDLAGNGYRRLLLVSTIFPGVLSGFINIVAAVSIFIPATLRLVRQSRFGPAGLLLPMAASALVGANLSLIGASHNLVVNSFVQQQTDQSFGMFEFAPVGLVLLLCICIYSLLFSKRLLNRKKGEQTAGRDSLHRLIHTYELNDRIWELRVQPGSTLCRKPLKDNRIGEKYGLSVFMALRRDKQLPIEDGSFIVRANDVLALGGNRTQVNTLVEAQSGLVIMGQPAAEEDFTWSAFDLVEVVVPPHSPVIGRTLRELGIQRKTGLTPVGLWRDHQPVRTGIQELALQVGDALLLFGSRDCVRDYKPEPEFLWLIRPREQESPLHLRKYAPFATLIFLAVIASAAFNLLSVAMAALAGAIAMVLLGILDTRQAYRHISWQTLILIAGMYPVGTALQNTGAAAGLADLIIQSAGRWGAVPALVAVGVLALILTQPMHNAVAALIVTPVALQVASALGASPKAFALAVIVGASASFLMPIGHPAPLLVRKPGDYRIGDYYKFGIGAAVIVVAVIAVVIPLLWPLEQT